MGAQSISSASQSSSIATTIVMDIESMMWDTVETTMATVRSCSRVKTFTKISNSAPIQRDRFIPTAAMNDTNE
eukprot:4904990-Amphidinium_carterae.1